MKTLEKANKPKRIVSNDLYRFEIFSKHVSVYDIQNSKFVMAIDVRTVRRILNAMDGKDDA